MSPLRRETDPDRARAVQDISRCKDELRRIKAGLDYPGASQAKKRQLRAEYAKVERNLATFEAELA